MVLLSQMQNEVGLIRAEKQRNAAVSALGDRGD